MLTFIGKLYPQTGTKLHKTLPRTLGCSKDNIVFNSQRNLSNVFRFIDRLPYDLVFGVIYIFQCDKFNSFYYDETDKHLKVKSGEHIGISLLTFNKIKSLV